MFCEKMAAARPYIVSLALATTSSSSLNLNTTMTGPKISSFAILALGGTLEEEKEDKRKSQFPFDGR